MKPTFQALLAGGFVFATTLLFPTTGHAGDSNSPLLLWYRQPATDWLEALPVGNGRLGAMVFGGVTNETDPTQRGHPLVRRTRVSGAGGRLPVVAGNPAVAVRRQICRGRGFGPQQAAGRQRRGEQLPDHGRFVFDHRPERRAGGLPPFPRPRHRRGDDNLQIGRRHLSPRNFRERAGSGYCDSLLG